MYENDRIICGDINLCGCGISTNENCSRKRYKFVFNFSYIEENELYCKKNGKSRREFTVSGFETIICDCYYGFYGEFCEFESKSLHWMLVFFWLIIATMLTFLLLSLLRQKYQTRYRPPNNRIRFVDALNNNDLNE
uniref:EGF-like domain-containing protein n=1 Tax=Panagrolaimus davidi TaxID=227884 RepID=A0A914P711_9BILA